MCAYIPTDPTLIVFNEPVKCPHETIFYSAFLSATGEILSERIEKTVYWNEAKLQVEDVKQEKTDNTH